MIFMKLLLEKDKERLSYKHKKKIYARLLGGNNRIMADFSTKTMKKKKIL